MRVVFAHDHILKNCNKIFYTSGGFSDYITSRYTSVFGDVHLICRSVDVDSVPPNYSRISNEKISVIPISPKALNLLIPSLNIVREEVHKADAVICRLPSRIGSISAHYAIKYNKPLLVECVACPWDAYRYNGIIGILFGAVMWFFTRYYVYKSPFCLYVTKKFLQRRYPCKGKTLSCSDAQVILKRRIYGKLNQNKNDITLGTLANLDLAYKGQKDVIRAIAILNKSSNGRRYIYHLAGQGSDRKLRNLANRLNVSQYVYFDGMLRHEDVFSWLDSLDIYIQPSRQEGLPRSVIEAMSRGCPVIGTNVGGIPELIPESVQYSPGDINRLCRLLSNIDVESAAIFSAKNFEMSKQFTKENLDMKRTIFFKQFLESVMYHD